MTKNLDTINRENLVESLKAIEIPDSYIDNVMKKDFSDEAARWIYVAFEIATKITEFFSNEELATIVAGLNSPAPKKRIATFNRLVGLPDETDLDSTSGAAICMAGMIKSYIFKNNSEIINAEFKKHRETKEKISSQKDSEANIDSMPTHDFQDIVKMVLNLNDKQKKSLYFLLKQTIE